MNKINRVDGLRSIVFPLPAIPSGCLAGKLLMSNRTSNEKMKWLLISGLVLLILGFGLDLSHITPIINELPRVHLCWLRAGIAYYFWLSVTGGLI
jgi:predicted acyltransferase